MPSASRHILVVNDGSEVIRQGHADTAAFFDEMAMLDYMKARGLSYRFVVDDEAAHELVDLSPDRYACIVFCTNALIRNSGAVRSVLRQRPSLLTDFVRAGGGAVVLHQWSERPIEGLSEPRIAWRSRDGYRSALDGRPVDRDSPIFRYPHTIDLTDLRESAPGAWRNGFPIATTSLDFDGGFETDLESDIGPLIAHGSNLGRLVVTSLPLDYVRDHRFLENLIVYAMHGVPEVVVLHDEGMDVAGGLDLALARIGGAHTIAKVGMAANADARSVGGLADWLISRAGLCVVVGESKSIARHESALTAFVQNGGAIARLEADWGEVQQVRLQLGSRFGHEISNRLLAEAATMDFADWLPDALIHDMRDLLTAVDRAEAYLQGPSMFDHGLLDDLRDRCTEWLDAGQVAVDLGTALVVLELLAAVAPRGSCDTYLVRFAKELGQAEARSPELALSIALLKGDSEAISDLVGRLAGGRLSMAGAIRVLDVLRTHASPRLGLALSAKEAERVARLTGGPLLSDSGEDSVGWLNMDATASVVTGYAILARAGARAGVVTEVLARGAALLMRAYRQGELERLEPIARLRVLEALLALEQAYPVAAHEALLSIVDSKAIDLIEPAGGASLRLRNELQRMQARNQTLVSQVAELTDRADTLAQGLNERDRVAATLGRALWSLLFIGAVGLACATVIEMGRAALSDQSVETLLKGAGGVSAAIGFASAIWLAGQRLHLVPLRSSRRVLTAS